jgi:hypothetical protein
MPTKNLSFQKFVTIHSITQPILYSFAYVLQNKKGSANFCFKLYLQIAQKGSKIVYFSQKVPFLGQKIINYRAKSYQY